MNYHEIKNLFNFLDNNRKHFTAIQIELIESVKRSYKITGLITSVQEESLLNLKEKVASYEEAKEQVLDSALYGQLIEINF